MQPFPFQEEVWRRFLAGESGLVHAPTGFGKRLSAWMGPLIEAQSDPASQHAPERRADAPPLSVVWITPVRAAPSCPCFSKLNARIGRPRWLFNWL